MSIPQPPASPTRKHLDRQHREQRQTRMIVTGAILSVVIVAAVLLYGYVDQVVLRYRRPVAIVNGSSISAQEFRNFTKYYRYTLIRNAQNTYDIASMFGADETMLQQLLSQLQAYGAQLEPEIAAETALNQMIDAMLVKQEAQKQGITVSAEEIESRMQEVLDFFPNGTPTPTNTVAPFATATLSPLQQSMIQPTATLTPTAVPTTTVAVEATAEATAEATVEATPAEPTAVTPLPSATPMPTATPYTLEGYQGAYATMIADLSVNYEIPEETMRWIVESQLYREKMIAAQLNDIVCETEQVWAQHILVDDPALAVTIAEKARAGDDWYNLSATFSTDESVKNNGGDLGWFSRDRMVAEFSDAAFALTEIGQISDPVKTQFGYHVIRLSGKQTQPMTANECDSFQQSEFQTWIQGIRTTATIDMRNDYWREIFPLLPSLPDELRTIIDQANAASQQQTLPQGVPPTTP